MKDASGMNPFVNGTAASKQGTSHSLAELQPSWLRLLEHDDHWQRASLEACPTIRINRMP